MVNSLRLEFVIWRSCSSKPPNYKRYVDATSVNGKYSFVPKHWAQVYNWLESFFLVETKKKILGTCWNCLQELILKAGAKPLMTETL